MRFLGISVDGSNLNVSVVTCTVRVDSALSDPQYFGKQDDVIQFQQEWQHAQRIVYATELLHKHGRVYRIVSREAQVVSPSLSLSPGLQAEEVSSLTGSDQKQTVSFRSGARTRERPKASPRSLVCPWEARRKMGKRKNGEKQAPWQGCVGRSCRCAK